MAQQPNLAALAGHLQGFANDFPAVAGHLQGVAAEIPALANLPVMQVNQQLAQLQAQLTQSTQHPAAPGSV